MSKTKKSPAERAAIENVKIAERSLKLALRTLLSDDKWHSPCARNPATSCPVCGPIHRALKQLGEVSA